MAIAELHNTKQMMPSFSVSLVSDVKPKSKKVAGANSFAHHSRAVDLLPSYIPHGQDVRQNVELTFPRRGVYRQDALGLRTRSSHLVFFRRRGMSIRTSKRLCIPRFIIPRKSFTKFFRL